MGFTVGDTLGEVGGGVEAVPPGVVVGVMGRAVGDGVRREGDGVVCLGVGDGVRTVRDGVGLGGTVVRCGRGAGDCACVEEGRTRK